MRALIALAVGFGLLVLAAVAAELAFGTWFRADPLAGLDLRRDSAVTVSAAPLYPGGAEFVYRRDHWGFRGPGIAPGRIAVLTLGGTTTTQVHLPEEQTWQAVMERELHALGSDALVANAGMDAHAAVPPLRALREWFPRVPGLAPHFLLFLVGVDDLGEASDAPPPGLWDRVRERSALRRWAASVLPSPGRLAAGIPLRGEIASDTAKAHLRAVAQAAHAMGAVPILVTQPVGDDSANARLLLGINQAAREVCRDEGLLCLDPARDVRFEADDFYDYLHNTPAGADKIGRWLASKLAGLV
jgi:hypothetical protein